MAELVFYRRSEELMRVNLDGRKVTIGRGATNDILVPDPSVSRQQFSVRLEGEKWALADLSGHGTDVAGKLQNQIDLQDGVDIALGQWRAVFNVVTRAGVDAETTQRGDHNTVVEPVEHSDARPLPARLRVHTANGDAFVQFKSEATVGSGPAADVKLDDNRVSATHLKLERRGNSFLVRDLGSKNGTFVGAIRIVEAEVPFGCPIKVGAAELTFVRHDRDFDAVSFEGMVGTDPGMKRVYETIDRVAPSAAAVSIFGESGTGKELVARAIHNRSSRAGKPFVPVNCGAISKELIESELFGHEKGAFTGAERLRKGAFEEADGGTLFLDEIGELAIGLQAKLLRALELGEIKRVGATRPLNVDVRIVAATNRDLKGEVKKGGFREDLYYRLCVIPLQLPPLRARRGDVKALVAHFLKLFAPPSTTVGLTPAAEQVLVEYDWPGNVRELKNTIHRSMLMRRGALIDAADITFDRDSDAHVASDKHAPDPCADDLERVYLVDKVLEAVEDEAVAKAVKRLGASVSILAKSLGLSRGAVYRKLQKLGISASSAPAAQEEPEGD